MSTINPSTLYSQNQGIFDSRPYMLQAQRLDQARAAREEATNKYYQDLPNRINGAGLDDGDVEGLNNRVNNIKQFWIQNASQIKKGTTPENYNYQKLIREAQGYTEIGKNKVKDLVSAGMLRNQKGNEHLDDDGEFTATLEKAARPIDGGYEGINMATLVKPIKPYDPIQHEREMKSFVPTTFDVEVERDPNDSTKDIQHKIPKYTSDDFMKIGFGAANKYSKNRSYKKEVDDIIANPVTRQSANDLYKKYFKKDAETPQDYAVAFDISVAMPKAEKVDRVNNGQRITAARNKEWDRRNAIGYEQSMAKIRANIQNGTNEPTGNSLDEINGVVGGGRGIGIKNGVVRQNGNLYSGTGIKLPKALIPSSIISSLKSSGYKPEMIDEVELTVQDGIITGFKSEHTGVVSRQNMGNYQRTFDKEPIKAKKQEFGNTKATVPTQQKKVTPPTTIKGKVR